MTTTELEPLTPAEQNELDQLVANLTPAELEEVALLEAQPGPWIAAHCKIIDKAGNLVSLVFNAAQWHTERVIAEMEAKGLPVRIVVLKARQMGETTRAAGRLYWRANKKKNRRGMISAHDADSTEEIFSKIQLFQESNPEVLEAKYSSRREITYVSPHRSSIIVRTAGNENLGRTKTIDDFHGSESAMWPDPEQSMLAVNQCVPEIPDTLIELESTPKGKGGLFYRYYKNAKKADQDKNLPYMLIPEPPEDEWNGYYRVFNPWYIDAEYRKETPPDFVKTPEECKLAEKHQLDDEQIYWRRRIIQTKCDGDIDFFRQEYPSDDLECFLLSGRPVFDAPKVHVMAEACRPPHITGRMIRSPDGPTLDPYQDAWVEVWEDPHHAKHYAIGADTAEGLDPTETNDPDYNSAHVIEVSTNRTVAKIRGRFDPDLFGEQLDLLGRWYNDAYLGWEVNNTSGGSVRSVLKRLRYPNMHYREKWDKDAEEMTLVLGWYTDRVTKGTLIADLGQAIREDLIYVPSANTCHELSVFVWGKDGKCGASSGEHDDDTISLAIAWQMAAIQAVLQGSGAVPDRTGEDDTNAYDDFDQSKLVGGLERDLVGDDEEEEEWE